MEYIIEKKKMTIISNTMGLKDRNGEFEDTRMQMVL